MSKEKEIHGQLSSCERCGAKIFRKCVGEGEADGGYTRWNKFEPYPEGWVLVNLFPLEQLADEKYVRLCPICSAEHDRIIREFMDTPMKGCRKNELLIL